MKQTYIGFVFRAVTYITKFVWGRYHNDAIFTEKQTQAHGNQKTCLGLQSQSDNPVIWLP